MRHHQAKAVQRFAQLKVNSLWAKELLLKKNVVSSQQNNTKNYDNEENLHYPTVRVCDHLNDGTRLARKL